MARRDLVAWLVERQGERLDGEFAVELGVHRINWWRLRTGQREAGLVDLGRAVDRFGGDPHVCLSICQAWHKPSDT